MNAQITDFQTVTAFKGLIEHLTKHFAVNDFAKSNGLNGLYV